MKYLGHFLQGKYILIPDNLKADFNHERHLTNYNRANLLNVVLLIVSFILLITDWLNVKQGLWLENYGYKLLFYMHITLAVGMLAFFLLKCCMVYYSKHKPLNKFYNYYALTVVMFLLFIGAAFSAVDQTIHGQATIFIISMLVPAAFVYLIPYHSMIIYFMAFIIFMAGITVFQANPDILRGHYLNGSLMFILSLMIARVFYNQRVVDFLNKKTILFQKNELEKKTGDLEETMNVLIKTQKHLVQSEKLAALGNLVAGIAHEVNTPVGVAVTAATHLKKMTEDLVRQFQNNELRKSSLTDYLDSIKEGSQILESNLRRASELIKSFKQVAVDQSNQSLRQFNVKEYMNEILLSMQPKTKYYKHEIIVNCPDDIEIYSYPGAISQIITNLLMNALTHAFDRNDQGTILINISKNEDKLSIKFSDNGKGIPEDYNEKVFEPFFTTSRKDGGTGLGLHVVYNLVTQILNGTISVSSKLNQGTEFSLEFPLMRGKHNVISDSR